MKFGRGRREGKERNAPAEGARLGRLLDVDGHGRRHQADDFVARRRSWATQREHLHERRCGASHQDGNAVYLIAVDRAFGVDVDYGQMQKLYTRQGGGRYSPAMFVGAKRDRDGRSASAPYLDHLRGAAESDDADAHAPLHAPHQWVLEEGRESRARRCAALHLLQFLQGTSVAPRHSGDGGWSFGSCVES